MLEGNPVLLRTEKGEEELKTRKYGLSVRMRGVLILVDGNSSLEKIQMKAYGMPDVDSAIESLLDEGYIEPVADSEDGVAVLKSRLKEAAREILGDQAEKVVSRIEDAPDDMEGLRAAVEGSVKLVKLTIDEKKAEELMKKAEEILR